MKLTWALLALSVSLVIWCVLGICGWWVAGDPTVDAVCLPFNVIWAVWAVVLIRKERRIR